MLLKTMKFTWSGERAKPSLALELTAQEGDGQSAVQTALRRYLRLKCEQLTIRCQAELHDREDGGNNVHEWHEVTERSHLGISMI